MNPLSPVHAAERELYTAMESLTAKERLYVEARLAGKSPLQSARIAGYKQPRVSAERLEKNELVQLAIQSTLRVLRHRQMFTREDIAAGIMDAIHTASTAGEIIQGWREIGRLFGLYAPEKKETTIKRESVEQMSDDELARLAAIEAEFEVLDDIGGTSERTDDVLPGAGGAEAGADGDPEGVGR